MTNRSLRWVLRLHPRAWRERYSAEVRDLSEELLNAHEMGRTRLLFGLMGSGLLEHLRTRRRNGRFAVLSAVVTVIVVGGAVALATNLVGSGKAPIGGPSEGTVPQSVAASGNYSAIPDYVAVASGKYIVGYAPKSDLFPKSPKAAEPIPSMPSIPVYNRALTNVVGHLVAGVGYVPDGSTKPRHSITTTTVLTTVSSSP